MFIFTSPDIEDISTTFTIIVINLPKKKDSFCLLLKEEKKCEKIFHNFIKCLDKRTKERNEKNKKIPSIQFC